MGNSLEVTNSGQVAAPPHPLDGQWWVKSSGQKYGPYNGHLMKDYIAEGRVNSNTEVCLVGGKYWQLASEDRVLCSLLKSASPPFSQAQFLPGPQINNSANASVVIAGGAPTYFKSAWAAFFLGLLFPGAGYMYVGQVLGGIMSFFLIVVLTVAIPVFGLGLWILTALGAANQANRLNRTASLTVTNIMR